MLQKILTKAMVSGILLFVYILTSMLTYVLKGVGILLLIFVIIIVSAKRKGLLNLYEAVDYTCAFLEVLVYLLNVVAILVSCLPFYHFLPYTWWAMLAVWVASFCILLFSLYIWELHTVFRTLRTRVKKYPNKSFLILVIYLPPKDRFIWLIGLGLLCYGFSCIIDLLF